MYFFISSSDSFRTPKFIDKTYNSFCTDQCLKELIDGKLQCKCGEDTTLFDWTWQNENSSNIKMSEEGKEVLFHPVYSSGTAAVRGNVPFQQNYHYYWEIKMVSKLYGTDVMIGVGTSKIILADWKFKFCSLLGIDSESWGYSYHGNIQHNKLRRKYGTKFGLGSIIGVHLDMCSGTLEYFLNRKSLGIAFRGLKGKELYPMVCSTAAQSAVRVTCCVSKESTLQMSCLERIMKHSALFNQYRKIPGLTRICDKQYFWMQPQPEPDEKRRLAELDEDVALSLVDGSYLNKNKKLKSVRLISLLYDQELEDNDSDSNDIFKFGDESSNDSVDFDASVNTDSTIASDVSNEERNRDDGPSTSGPSVKIPENIPHLSSFTFSCKLCKDKSHSCIDCIIRRRLQEEDYSSDASESTLLV